MKESKEAMKLALEFVEYHSKYWNGEGQHPQEIATALREALAEQPAQQEPVAFCVYCDGQFTHNIYHSEDLANFRAAALEEQYPKFKRKVVPLYESPPQREPLLREIAALSANALDDYKMIQKLMAERQPLTDEEIEACIHDVDEDGIGLFAFARAIEAAHGIKAPQPPVTQRTWVSLTKEEVNSWELPDCPTVFEFVQFIEDKIKDKNI